MKKSTFSPEIRRTPRIAATRVTRSHVDDVARHATNVSATRLPQFARRTHPVPRPAMAVRVAERAPGFEMAQTVARSHLKLRTALVAAGRYGFAVACVAIAAPLRSLMNSRRLIAAPEAQDRAS